jgi:hypothetical protein
VIFQYMTYCSSVGWIISSETNKVNLAVHGCESMDKKWQGMRFKLHTSFISIIMHSKFPTNEVCLIFLLIKCIVESYLGNSKVW